MSGEKVVGICGKCGGQVKVHTGAWYGINPPTPACVSCGRGVKQSLPVLEMDGTNPPAQPKQLLCEEWKGKEIPDQYDQYNPDGLAKY